MDTNMCTIDNGVSKKIVIKTPDMKYDPYHGGMGAVFFKKMRTYGQAIAQIDCVTGEKDTYASLFQRCVRTAIKMRALGVTSNDIVTICSINHLNCCVPFIAALFLGAKTANLDPSLSLNDASFLLKQASPKMIFVGEEATSLIEKSLQQANLKSKVVVFGKSTKHLQFSSFLLPSFNEKYFQPVTISNDKETAAIFFSSGTTGLPKGICLSHYGLLGRSYQLWKMGYAIDVVLTYVSMYWISSSVLITNAILSKGCRLVSSVYNPNTIWNLISKYKATLIFLAPIQVIHLCKVDPPRKTDLSSLKQFTIGGGSVHKEFINQLRSMLPHTHVSVVYGLTENCGLISGFNFNKADDIRCLKEKPESSGRIIDGVTYKVVDTETGETLGPHQKGELRIISNFEMNGYYNMDANDAWDGDGFLKTGDVVYYDDDYCLYIVDRVKELLKFQMWHIAPALLEGIIVNHPAVESAVVVGLPHPIDGDHPMSAIVLKDSYIGKVTTSEMQKFVDERVDDRQRLRGGVKFIDKIPYTPSGKPKRMYIRDMVLRGEL